MPKASLKWRWPKNRKILKTCPRTSETTKVGKQRRIRLTHWSAPRRAATMYCPPARRRYRTSITDEMRAGAQGQATAKGHGGRNFAGPLVAAPNHIAPVAKHGVKKRRELVL